MKIKFLLPLLLIPILIIPVFAIPAGTGFDEFCEKKISNTKTTAADFICELDIFQMKDDIASNSDTIISLNTTVNQQSVRINELEDDITSNGDTIISLNTTVNQISVRINELTILHYPGDEAVLVPPVPELVPLPEQPLPGDNPEFAPDTPKRFEALAGVDGISVQWQRFDVTELPRGVKPPTINILYSDDGVNWISRDNIVDTGNFGIRPLDKYTEYLVKLRAVNEFGTSPFTEIDSGITTPTGRGETGYIYRVHLTDDQSVQFRWYAASWLFGYERTGSVIEKSINYGDFTHLVDVGVERNGDYIDTDVEDGNVYSYRIQTTTTNEVHTRSGFTSILYTLD